MVHRVWHIVLPKIAPEGDDCDEEDEEEEGDDDDDRKASGKSKERMTAKARKGSTRSRTTSPRACGGTRCGEVVIWDTLAFDLLFTPEKARR